MSKGPVQTGSTNSTQTSSPWGGQVPFLTGGSYPGSWGQIPGTQASVTNGQGTSQIDANNQGVLGIMPAAAGLYENFTPQYFQGQTYAPPTATQNQALEGTQNQALYGLGNSNDVLASNTGIATGGMAAQDPALGYFENFANNNVGANNAGTGVLGNIQANNYGIINPSAPALNYLQSNNAGVNNAGAPTLQDYASGNELSAGNPNTSGIAQSVLSQVVPSIQSQFINGGALNSPEAAYATSQGATAALAPQLFQAYQQEQQNQLGAANSLASNTLAGAGLQGTAATALGNQALAGTGLQQTAANDLGNQALAGAGLQTTNANNLQTGFGQNVQQELTGQALAPATSQMPYNDLSQLYSSGATDQANQQAAINDAMTRWNYGQTLPYDMLNQYIGEVTGNYGGTTTLNQPILTNPTANTVSSLATGAGALGALGTGASAIASSPIGSGIGSLFGLLALSDRRTKTDIEPVGMLNNGLPVYSYRYFGSLMPQIGVMADEVEQVNPEAVYTHPSGYKMVDYGAAVQ